MIAFGKLILYVSFNFFSFRPVIATSKTISTLDRYRNFRHHHKGRSCVEGISRGGFQNLISVKPLKKCSSKITKSRYSTTVSFQSRRHRPNKQSVSTCWMDPTTFGEMINKDELNQKNKKKSLDLYGISNSSWKSKEWNWGYGHGTGHDCAMICRHNYHTKQSRQVLIDNMLHSSVYDVVIIDWQEIKLIVGLMIQNLRRNEKDRTVVDAFNEIMNYLIEGRYESDGYNDDDNVPLSLFVNDMKERYYLLKPSHDEQTAMNEIKWKVVDSSISTDHIPTNQRYQQNVVGLVLQAMKFVERGC